MKKLFFLGTLILISFFFACKKKEATPETPPATQVNNPPPSAIIPAGLSASTDDEYCNLITLCNYNDFAGVITKDSVVVGVFYSGPRNNINSTHINGGNLSLNGINVPYYNSPVSEYLFYGSPPTNITGSITWSIAGTGTVTSFSQNFITSYPKYTGGNLLPDTCHKSNGIALNISGVTNFQNSINISITDINNNGIYKTVSGNGLITITSSELTSFPLNQNFNISISIDNVFSATHSSVKHRFTNSISYNKTCYLK